MSDLIKLLAQQSNVRYQTHKKQQLQYIFEISTYKLFLPKPYALCNQFTIVKIFVSKITKEIGFNHNNGHGPISQ